MPRLDNSSEIVQVLYNLDFDENDPGLTPPLDLCQRCATGWLDHGFIDHPDYEDDVYNCADCSDVLTDDDN